MKDEVERLRAKKKKIYEDLNDAVHREWVGLTDEEIDALPENIEVEHVTRSYDL